MMGGPGPWSCGSTVAIRHSNPCYWSTDRGPGKIIQHRLGSGNAESWTWVRAPLSDRALVLGSRSTGLGKVVQEPRARFHVARWGVFCHQGQVTKPPAPSQVSLSDSTVSLDLPDAALYLDVRFCFSPTRLSHVKIHGSCQVRLASHMVPTSSLFNQALKARDAGVDACSGGSDRK